MAPPLPHQRSPEILPRSLPQCRIRLHDHPYLPRWSDRLHGVLQRCKEESQGAVEELESRGRGEVVQILQQGGSQGKLCTADFCEEGAAVERGELETWLEGSA